jgi:hypothetical protein
VKRAQFSIAAFVVAVRRKQELMWLIPMVSSFAWVSGSHPLHFAFFGRKPEVMYVTS